MLLKHEILKGKHELNIWVCLLVPHDREAHVHFTCATYNQGCAVFIKLKTETSDKCNVLNDLKTINFL